MLGSESLHSRRFARGSMRKGDDMAATTDARCGCAAVHADGRAWHMPICATLFSPRCVAIVGQSDDASKTPGRPLKFLRQMGYAGRVYPVNPRREQVLGERAWPSLAALPEAPEHVYMVTPTEPAVEAVEECGRLGVKVATVLADGFAEAGAAGDWRARRGCARPARAPASAWSALRASAWSTCAQGHADGERRLRRAGPAGRAHLRRLPQRQPDRCAALARQGARHRLRRPGLGRQRGRPLARRDLRGDAR